MFFVHLLPTAVSIYCLIYGYPTYDECVYTGEDLKWLSEAEPPLVRHFKSLPISDP